jgi:hypothetical protein
MPEKPWDEMNVEDKLGLLRADIQWLIDIGNANNAMLDARNNAIIQRLSSVEENVNKILTAVLMDKPPSSS